eukprot:1147355-Pelagomonas_calceolata.AAC.7
MWLSLAQSGPSVGTRCGLKCWRYLFCGSKFGSKWHECWHEVWLEVLAGGVCYEAHSLAMWLEVLSIIDMTVGIWGWGALFIQEQTLKLHAL